MFKCQYCQSHVFLKTTKVQWQDLLGETECNRAFDKIHQPHQYPDFYVTHPSGEVVYATEHYGLVRVNAMRYWLPDDSHITLTEQLINYKATTDIALDIMLERDLMRPVGRPTFEVRLESNPSTRFRFNNLDKAISHMFKLEREQNPMHIKYAIDDVIESLKPE